MEKKEDAGRWVRNGGFCGLFVLSRPLPCHSDAHRRTHRLSSSSTACTRAKCCAKERVFPPARLVDTHKWMDAFLSISHNDLSQRHHLATHRRRRNRP